MWESDTMFKLKFWKKERKVYFRNGEFFVELVIIENSNLIYFKKPLVLKKRFKIKEELEKEHFDVFCEGKSKESIPIIKLSQENVTKNSLNYAIRLYDTDVNVRYCILSYHKGTTINEVGEEETMISFFLEQKVIEKEKIKFKLPIGKYRYAELEGKKGLMVIS